VAIEDRPDINLGLRIHLCDHSTRGIAQQPAS